MPPKHKDAAPDKPGEPPTVSSRHLLFLTTPQQPRRPMRSSADPSATSRVAACSSPVASPGAFSILFIRPKMEPLSTFTQIPTARMTAPANYRRQRKGEARGGTSTTQQHVQR